MIVTIAGFITTLGFALFIAGYLLDMTGIAVIGGVLVLGVGVMVTTNGLEYKSGTVETAETSNRTVTDFQYQQTNTPQKLQLGSLWMLAGGVFVLRALNNAAG